MTTPKPRRTASPPAPPPAKTKLELMAAMLRRPKGASLAELIAATGWQAHSVRGALAAALKKKLGAKVGVTVAHGVRVYRAPKS